MRSLEDQIASNCKHFNGIMNDCCKIGIKYSDVRVGKPYQFPCIKTGGSCESSEFPNSEEVRKQLSEISEVQEKVLTAYLKIKEHYKVTKVGQGKLPCDCGGQLNYTVAAINGHIWAKCKDCGIYFNE